MFHDSYDLLAKLDGGEVKATHTLCKLGPNHYFTQEIALISKTWKEDWKQMLVEAVKFFNHK
eukprot:13340229-Ditylum_brightwellii.AAC.1